MTRKRRTGPALLVALAAGAGGAALPRPAGANDAAASVKAGGIELRSEPRVSMKKERLAITRGEKGWSVRVAYEFRNETGEDVRTRVAFPLPRYGYPGDYPLRVIDDFTVRVDGRDVPFETETRAFVKDRDVTAELRAAGIDIPVFGGCGPITNGLPGPCPVERLSVEERQRLRALGAFEGEGELAGEFDWPEWDVVRTHHWEQVFPGGEVVRVDETPARLFGRGG